MQRELKTDFLRTSRGRAVEGKNFRGRARARGVPLARSIYKLTKTKTKQNKNRCLPCRLDFRLQLVFSLVKNNCWCVVGRPGAYLRLAPPLRLHKNLSKLKNKLNND